MSNVTFEHNFDEIINGIEQMGKDIKKTEVKATSKMANIIKVALKRNLKRSQKEHVHMADDIKISSLKTDESQNDVRIIKGGKKTHYKWKWLEFGTSKMRGNQFISKSLKETDQEVVNAANEEVGKVVK